MARTKKGLSTARFGTRYGARIRHQVAEIEKKQKALYLCPSCSRSKVKRIAIGIWQCMNCNHKFAGKAYSFE